MGYNDDGWGGGGSFNSYNNYNNRNDKHKLPVFKDVDLSKVNILKDFKTMPGKIVFSWMGQPKAFFPDRIDRLNGYVVPAVFLLCVAVLSTTVYGWIGGEAISCLPSKEIHSKDEHEYAVDYCMSKNHYYVHPDEQIPWSDQQRYARQLGYYHWVVVFLLLQAFFFWLPSCLWSYASTATGINFAGMLGFAKQINKKCQPRILTHEDRPKLVDTLAAEIEDSLRMRGPQRVVGLRFGRRIGSYVVTLYLLVKLLYIVNVSAQFLLLNAFLGGSYAWWGWEVVQSLITGENWQDSPVFPRLTLCDVPIRRLGDSPRYTLQCHLRVNTYNEKAFFLIWWFLAFVAVMTALNLISYLFSFCFWPFCCHTREDYVRFLCRDRRHRDIMWSSEKIDVEMVQNFADNCLGNDGVLLFMFIGNQAGFITAREVMGRLFDNYRWRWEHPSKPVPADIAYKTMNEVERRAVIPKQKAPKTSASNSNDPFDQNNSNNDWAQSTTYDNNGGQTDDETTNNDDSGNANFGNSNVSISTSNWTPLNRGRGRRGNVR